MQSAMLRADDAYAGSETFYRMRDKLEEIFGIPGIGSLTSASIQTSDYYLKIAVLFFYSVITLLSMLLVDLSYGVVDPRIRIGGGKIRE